MAASIVQTATNAVASTSAVCSFGSATTVGNLLLALVANWSGNPSAAAGWTRLYNSSATRSGVAVFYQYVATSATNYTPFSTFTDSSICIYEISGMTGTIGTDVVAWDHTVDISGPSSGNTASSGAYSSPASNCMALAMYGGDVATATTQGACALTTSTGAPSQDVQSVHTTGISTKLSVTFSHELISGAATSYTVSGTWASGPSQQSSFAQVVWVAWGATPPTVVTVGLGSLTYTGNAVGLLAVSKPGAGAVTYTGNSVTTLQGNQVGQGAVTYTGQAATVARGASPSAGSLAYTGNAPSLLTGHEVGVGEITYGGDAPEVARVVTVGAGHIVYTGNSAALLEMDISQGAAVVVYDIGEPDTLISQAAAISVFAVEPDTLISQAAAVAVFDYVPCASTFCQVWLIERLDGESLAFTSLDEDIDFLGQTARACGSLNPTATEAVSDLDSVANMELTGIIDDDAISEKDLWAGLYDGARVEVWLVDWTGTDTPKRLAAGTCGKMQQGDGFNMEVLGNAAKLQQQAVTEVVTPKCRWTFGKGQCPVDVDALVQNVAVTASPNRRTVASSDLMGYITHPLRGGLVTFLSGANTGFSSEIKDFDPSTGVISLWVPMAYPALASDHMNVAPGCDLLGATCKHYGAYLDFGGFPDVPGDDAMNDTPDAKYTDS